jgi:hypothetical protein
MIRKASIVTPFGCIKKYVRKNISVLVESGYNEISLYDTSCIASDILWYAFVILRVSHNIKLLLYNNARL